MEVSDDSCLNPRASVAYCFIAIGAVGVEMVAEMKLVQPHLTVKLVHSQHKLLSSEPIPDDFKDRTLSVLQETGVEVIMGRRVTDITTVETDTTTTAFSLSLSDGTNITAGHFISAVSRSIPSSSFFPQTALDKWGYVKVTRSYEPSVLLMNAC